MNKYVIKIISGDFVPGHNNQLFEEHLHPKSQVEKVKKELEDEATGEKIVWTNSPFVAEAFNSYGKKKGYTIKFYEYVRKKEFVDSHKVGFEYVSETTEILPETYFDKMAKPFENLILEEG